jgi:putative transposase
MTLPRQFLPNTTYFITRRTTQREFWLKPTALTKQIFLYCIAVAAQKTGVKIHCATVLSNHYHAIVSDPHMKIAEFYGWVHEYVAKAINCSRGRWENMWSTEKTSAIPLVTPEDVLDKTAYVLCNPVSAHLIARAKNWKGVWLYRQSHCQTVSRPKVYFSNDGTMPEKVQLEICRPESHQNMTRDAYEKMVAEEVERREQDIALEMQKSGMSFMGMDAVLLQSYSDKPRSTEQKRVMNPRFAGIDKEVRKNVIKRYKQFLAYYREALSEWKNGNRDVVFPPGTYALRILSNVNVAPG